MKKRIALAVLLVALVVLALYVLRVMDIWDPFAKPKVWNVNDQDLYTLDTFDVTFENRWGDTMHALAGTLVLPEVRRIDDANHIQIAFGLLPAYRKTENSPLVMLAGGPGSSGIDWGRSGYFYLFRELREDFDIILLDQRGTGRSIPNLACANNLKLPVDLEEEAPRTLIQSILDSAGDCLDEFTNHGVDLSGYHSAENAADIDDLRKALGYERISLYGYSYGCQLAHVYLRDFEKHVDKVIMAGPVAPELALKLPVGVHSEFVGLDSLVRKDRRLVKYVPDLLDMMQEVHHGLANSAQDVSVPTMDAVDDNDGKLFYNLFKVVAFFKPGVKMKMTDFHLQLMTQADIGNDYWLSYFPAYYYKMQQGEWREVGNRLRNFKRRPLPHGLMITTNCATSYTDERQEVALKQERGTLLAHVSTSFGRDRDDCLALGVSPMEPGFLEPITSQVPVLMIGGSLDGRTPLSNLDTIASRLPNSQRIVVHNAGHGNLMDNQIKEKVKGFLIGADSTDGEVFRRLQFVSPVPYQFDLRDSLYRVLNAAGIDACLAAYQNLRNTWLDAEDYVFDFSEITLNALGYQLLGEERVEEAIAMFDLNCEIFPDAWNAFDSLGEALERKGAIQRSIAMYRRSIELNFMNGNGQVALKRLLTETRKSLPNQ